MQLTPDTCVCVCACVRPCVWLNIAGAAANRKALTREDAADIAREAMKRKDDKERTEAARKVRMFACEESTQHQVALHSLENELQSLTRVSCRQLNVGAYATQQEQRHLRTSRATTMTMTVCCEFCKSPLPVAAQSCHVRS